MTRDRRATCRAFVAQSEALCQSSPCASLVGDQISDGSQPCVEISCQVIVQPYGGMAGWPRHALPVPRHVHRLRDLLRKAQRNLDLLRMTIPPRDGRLHLGHDLASALWPDPRRRRHLVDLHAPRSAALARHRQRVLPARTAAEARAIGRGEARLQLRDCVARGGIPARLGNCAFGLVGLRPCDPLSVMCFRRPCRRMFNETMKR